MRRAILVCGIIIFLLVPLALSGAAGPGNTLFSHEIGPFDVKEPIQVTLLEAPEVTARSILPGDNLTFRYEIKNTVDRDYWILAWTGWSSTEEGQFIWTESYVEIVTAEGKISYNPWEPILIQEKTTNILTMTLKIREDSPTAKGITVYSTIARTLPPKEGQDALG